MALHRYVESLIVEVVSLTTILLAHLWSFVNSSLPTVDVREQVGQVQRARWISKAFFFKFLIKFLSEGEVHLFVAASFWLVRHRHLPILTHPLSV